MPRIPLAYAFNNLVRRNHSQQAVTLGGVVSLSRFYADYHSVAGFVHVADNAVIAVVEDDCLRVVVYRYKRISAYAHNVCCHT